jgi:hypothetical protein
VTGHGVAQPAGGIALRSRQAVRCLALDAAAVTTVRLLRAAGVPSVLLKGPATASRLYASHPGVRRYSDVDLLVAPASFERAQDVLLDHGYASLAEGCRSDDFSWHERPWRVPGDGELTIDLHRGFAGVGDADAFWTEISSATEDLALAGGHVPVPNIAGTALVVALHAAAPARVMKPRTDLLRALDLLSDQVWRDAAAASERCGASSAFGAGLHLVPAGAALADRLGLRSAGSASEWVQARCGTQTAQGLAALADQPTAGAAVQHIGYLLRRLVPSPNALRLNVPLARRGRIGLLLAYGARSGRVVWELPRTVVDLRSVAIRPRRPVLGRRVGRPVPWRAAARACRAGDGLSLRTTWWSTIACLRVRRQLRRVGLAEVAVAGPPPGTGAHLERAMLAGLRLFPASCLEGALVRQRWYASRGVERELVIGVSSPSAGFRAHAWLDGETTANREQLVELARRR